MTIYLERDGNLIAMTERSYEAEVRLQKLIATHPDLLAGDEDPDRRNRWVLIEREVPIADRPDGGGRWSLDHLFVDQDGVPTLVEVKRSSDTRIRREVIGQMLEYAANGPRYWPVETLREQFAARCARQRDEPDDVLRAAFGGELNIESWWEAVATNLREGTLRLLFVADEISNELKAIIEFLNEQMTHTTVLGVEVRQFVDEPGEHRTFVPRVLGLSEQAKVIKTGRQWRRWNLEQWLELHEDVRDANDVAVTRRLLSWARSRDVDIAFGTAMTNPAMKFERSIAGRRISVAHIYANGGVEIEFGQLDGVTPFESLDARRILAKRLEEIEGVEIPEDRLGRYPKFSIARLHDQRALDHFTQTLDWVFSEIERAQA